MKSLLHALIIVIILLIAPQSSALFTNSSDELQKGPELTITDIKGGLFSFVIKNIGDENVTNVSWHLKFEGGIMLLGRERLKNLYQTLEPNNEITIALKLDRYGTGYNIVFGFGRITIDITVDGDNADLVTETATGFIFGPIIIGLKET